MLYKIARDLIVKNKTIREEGGYVGIPFPFRRLKEYLPSLEQGHSIGILGPTGSGKSRFARFLALYIPYQFYKETGYPIRIFYLPLEDSKEKVMMNIMCHYIQEIYGYTVSLQELQSRGDRILPDAVLDAIYEAEKFFDEFEDVVTIMDGYSSPNQIFEFMKHYLETPEAGRWVEYEVDIKGRKEKQRFYEPNVHTILLLDNYSNIDLDKGEHNSEREAVIELAKKYVREELCNKYKVTAVQVLQTDFASEKAQYNSSGDSIMSKLEPNLASIGDVKTIARSMHLILAMFDPSRHDFLTYPQIPKKALSEDGAQRKTVYDLEILGNRFRALRVIKNNDSDSGMRVGLLFNALTEVFVELPPADSIEMDAIYKKFKNKGLSNPVKTNSTLFDAKPELFT